ncbi:MAG: hypothetical protein AAGH70_11735 [Pseudomonadota bacterium]
MHRASQRNGLAHRAITLATSGWQAYLNYMVQFLRMHTLRLYILSEG